MTIPPRVIAAASLCFALLGSASSLRALDPAKTLTQYAHDSWTTQTGLPQNSEWAVAETRDGYLWIGTQEGLVRFDGTRFTVFDRENTPVFKSAEVTALAEGKEAHKHPVAYVCRGRTCSPPVGDAAALARTIGA